MLGFHPWLLLTSWALPYLFLEWDKNDARYQQTLLRSSRTADPFLSTARIFDLMFSLSCLCLITISGLASVFSNGSSLVNSSWRWRSFFNSWIWKWKLSLRILMHYSARVIDSWFSFDIRVLYWNHNGKEREKLFTKFLSTRWIYLIVWKKSMVA